MRSVLRFLAVLAVLLMPFGMAVAPAAAPHHQAASMPMQHCPDQAPKDDGKGAFAECTMACAAALPAAESRAAEPMLIVCTPVQPVAAHRLDGLHPETLTPPPKAS